MKKYIYTFQEWDASLKDLLWWKGANLAEMTKLWIPVPPWFTITTDTCNYYLEHDEEFPDGMWSQVLKWILELEDKLWRTFWSTEKPLLVSVRSWAAVSMPWMMDTILNLWLNDKTVLWLAKMTSNERFAYDSYRRFIQMFGDVVLEVKHEKFEEILNKMKNEKWIKEDTELSAEDLKQLVISYKELIVQEIWMSFPDDPYKQLEHAIKAVFHSWQNPRAVKYRKIHRIPEYMWTAVNIQSMVFGNLGDTSWTWVAFTRNPSTWEKALFWEFLINAQWEDVVAWIRTPEEISSLNKVMPNIFNEFNDLAIKLESHFKDMQDIEFTIEEWKLYILQTRNGKRSAASWIKVAVDMVWEWIFDEKQAILKINIATIEQLMHPTIDQNEKKNVIAKWIPASPWAACGKVYFTAKDTENAVAAWEKAILLRHETSPEDIWWMHVAQWILTACWWATSHAAVVARWMWKPCVSWATWLIINEKQKKATVKSHSGPNPESILIKEWDFVTIDWNTWEVILWQCKMQAPWISSDFEKILTWCDKYKTLKVRTNADTPKDAWKAREFWAEWIWLCRTEHMFFDAERIACMREMILSSSLEQREKALAKLLPFQKKDFLWILEIMKWYPVTIRLLDPPLHEFLPSRDQDIEALAKEFGITFEQLKDKVMWLHESNPMLGHRWCRLMMTYPEIAKMQTRAIVEAACELKKNWIDVKPEIMIPLVWLESELITLREIIENEMRAVFVEKATAFEIPIWTMIELPRACVRAHRIANHADFFSFWTNDLTQMTFWFSRDDVGKFLPEYIEKWFLDDDPFKTLDVKWVWALIQIWVQKWRQFNENIKIWICGEHWWDPASIDFCYHNDFNYVSCSPYRVPVARIAAAQSYLRKWG